ncbi:MAG: MFS transporter [Pirellulales bacterium]
MNSRIGATAVRSLAASAQYLVLLTTFLGWMGAGMEMALMVPATRPAIQGFMAERQAQAAAAARTGQSPAELNTAADQWLSLFVAAFLLGAAAGGMVFGWLGDRIGRAKAMGLSILCYSAISGLSYFATSPGQLLVLRFLACLGIGGMWPCGVALLMESVPGMSRAFLAGWIGTSANVGFLLLGLLMLRYPITPDTWRWVFLFGGTPFILGILVWCFLPESPRWLAAVGNPGEATSIRALFRPPYLQRTVLGIALGTVPLLGGWASGQRLVPWAVQVGEAAGLPQLSAQVLICWAVGAVVGSLAGGLVAHKLGDRASYFLMSALSLALSVITFLYLVPGQPLFLPAAFAVGLVGTMFFGWLPFFLPTLFPVLYRASGTGIAFNFGRIFSAGVLISSTRLSEFFLGDVRHMGAATSLIYIVGCLLACFVPRRSDLEP